MPITLAIPKLLIYAWDGYLKSRMFPGAMRPFRLQPSWPTGGSKKSETGITMSAFPVLSRNYTQWKNL
jgi:hypothetical protein